MRKTIGIVLLICACAAYAAQAQVISTLPDVEQTEESLFLYEVKLIEEFAERFNDMPDSYLRLQSKRLLGTDTFINRHRLIRSLFDAHRHWGADTGLFTALVLRQHDPAFVSLTDTNFYVSVIGTFETGHTRFKLPLVLQMRELQGGHCWMIAGVGSVAATDTVQAKAYLHWPGDDGNKFIPTTAHGSGFAVLRTLLLPGMPTPALFTVQALKDVHVQKLVAMIESGRARFIHTENIMFHFYGIDGWVFTVSRARRKQTNAGWLISGLTAVTAREKEALRRSLLLKGE